jgi:hypothetical protein
MLPSLLHRGLLSSNSLLQRSRLVGSSTVILPFETAADTILPL